MKLIYTLLISLIFIFANSIPLFTNTAEVVNAERQPPAYAKWGRLAMKKTKEKYPNAQIIDYLHLGAIKKNGRTIEKFKLWLRSGNKEFGVIVSIEFTTATEELIGITFKETSK